MIDYVKMQIMNIEVQRLKEHPNLDFVRGVSEKTGELQNRMVAEYHFCKITAFDSGTIRFSGSIHKLYNSIKGIIAPSYNEKRFFSKYRGYNGNLLNLDNIIEVRKHLCWLFKCSPAQMKLENIEFGVNAELRFNPQLFITGLLYHKNTPFEYRFHRHFAKVAHQHFEIKIYNKSRQYSLLNDTLRYEVKFNKMKELKAIGITALGDIESYSLMKVSELLLKRFDEVVYYDKTIYPEGLSKPKIKALKRYSDITYWLDELKPEHRDRHKKNLKKIILNNSRNLHQLIKDEILKKCVRITQLYKYESV